MNPQPNQRFTARGFALLVDRVQDGQVYFRRWLDRDRSNVEPMRMTLEAWNEQAEQLQPSNERGTT